MSEKTRLSLGILASALILGLLGDALFFTPIGLRFVPVGLNVTLWVLLLALTLLSTAQWGGVMQSGSGRWFMLPAMAFALAFAWRDSMTLGLANLFALSVCLILVGTYSKAGRVAVAGIGHYPVRAAVFVFTAPFSLLLIAGGDVKWGEIPRGRWSQWAISIGRGLAIALPVAFVFSLLLASADAVFSSIVANLFHWNVAEVVEHIFWIALWGSVAGAVVRGTLADRGKVEQLEQLSARPSLGILEIATTFGLLDAIFLLFVVVQLRYLFGGASLVEVSGQLTYAEYARRGFFELVAVAALALPLLLAADALVRKENPADVRVFRAFATGMVALLFVVMASALQRMRLYQEAFGLTELRLYTTVFILWLTAVFVWFLATVVRGRRDRFAFGSVVAGLVFVAALNLLNPDGFIVSVNGSRLHAGSGLDGTYVTSLSADAVPEIINLLPSLSDEDRRTVAQRVHQRWLATPPSGDIRAWNWGRQTAWATVNLNRELLSQLDQPSN